MKKKLLDKPPSILGETGRRLWERILPVCRSWDYWDPAYEFSLLLLVADFEALERIAHAMRTAERVGELACCYVTIAKHVNAMVGKMALTPRTRRQIEKALGPALRLIQLDPDGPRKPKTKHSATKKNRGTEPK